MREGLPREREHEYGPPAGGVQFGDLRRVTPISRIFGWDRALPIDRYYIEKFLTSCADALSARASGEGTANGRAEPL